MLGAVPELVGVEGAGSETETGSGVGTEAGTVLQLFSLYFYFYFLCYTVCCFMREPSLSFFDS